MEQNEMNYEEQQEQDVTTETKATTNDGRIVTDILELGIGLLAGWSISKAAPKVHDWFAAKREKAAEKKKEKLDKKLLKRGYAPIPSKDPDPDPGNQNSEPDDSTEEDEN